MIPRTEAQAFLRKIERRRRVAECKQRRALVIAALLSGTPYLDVRRRWRKYRRLVRRVYEELRAAGALGLRASTPKRPLRRPPVYRLPDGMTVVNGYAYRIRRSSHTTNQ